MPSFNLIKPDEMPEKAGEVVKEYKTPDIAVLNPRLSKKHLRETFQENLTARDAKFRISELVASQLSVEEEEAKRFNEKVGIEVEKRVAVVTEEAKKQGFVKGLGEGHNAGKEEEKERIKESLDRFEKMILNLKDLTRRVYAEHEIMLMNLIFEIATVVIRAQVSVDHDYVKRLVVEIIERSGAKEDIRVKLNRKDHANFEEIKARVKEVLGQVSGLSFEIDDSIPEAGCLVETSFGEIRVELEKEIQTLAKTLKDRLPKVDV